MKIGIAGCGGIGSNVADNLVRSGIKKLVIVDFDKVEESNLNRQNYFRDQVGEFKIDALRENLQRIDKSVNIEAINKKLNKTNIKDIFKDCDIVIEAFDKKHYKKIFFEEFADSGKLCVGASGIAGYDIDGIEIKKMDEFYLVGDFKTDSKDEEVYVSKLRIITSIMSNLVLEESGEYAKNLQSD
jgi:sulfur carrier protein ThiS adenylyltransferase